jgi:uncharacterized protein YndB with AHSA1/START domain
MSMPRAFRSALLGTTWTGVLLSLATMPGFAAAEPPLPDHFTQGVVEVTVTHQPAKRLDFVLTVPASLDQVWEAMTTPEGLVTWLTPAAKVEMTPGGLWECDYPGGKTAGGNVLSFLPKEILALSAMAPEEFPTVRKERTQAIFRFEAIDATHTRVRLAQIGWKQGDEWDRAFAYLARGNAQLMNMLVHRFTAGATDWQAMFKGAEHQH